MIKVYYTQEKVNSEDFIRRVLQEYCQLEAVELMKGGHGKPYLVGNPVYFNLSHTADTVAVAVAHQQVGLDLEAPKARECPALMKRLSDKEKEEDFFLLWTAKEAYVKYRGESLANLLSHLEYKNKVLYEDGSAIPAHLRHFTVNGMTACLCSETVEKIVLKKI